MVTAVACASASSTAGSRSCSSGTLMVSRPRRHWSGRRSARVATTAPAPAGARSHRAPPSCAGAALVSPGSPPVVAAERGRRHRGRTLGGSGRRDRSPRRSPHDDSAAPASASGWGGACAPAVGVGGLPPSPAAVTSLRSHGRAVGASRWRLYQRRRGVSPPGQELTWPPERARTTLRAVRLWLAGPGSTNDDRSRSPEPAGPAHAPVQTAAHGWGRHDRQRRGNTPT